jgi:hypothetical protein
MNKFVLSAIACAIGASACTHVREPTDAQLATLLRSDRTAAIDTNAQLDSNAIDCLRGWSGDTDLLKGLAMRFAGEDGRKSCRTDVDTWIANPMRNPDKFAFEDISNPKTVRRAIALQAARATAAMANPATRQIPTALQPAAQPLAPRAPDPTVDLGAAGAQLSEAETLCQQVQQAATAPNAKPNIKSYAAFCARSLRQLRATMEQVSRNGQVSSKLETQAVSATNMANIARNLLAEGKQ